MGCQRSWRRPAVQVALLAALLTQAPAHAQEKADSCKTMSDANLPAAFAAWGRPATAVTAGATAVSAARIETGVAIDATLLPSIEPALAPEQARKPANAHAGLFRVKIPTAGDWRVALGNGAWIDLIGPDGKAVKSSAHGHMAPCTSLKKAVEFPLAAGDYLIQITGNPGASLKLMVSAKP